MNYIFLDCDLMRFPNSGLYHYCLNLGNEVNKLLEKENDSQIRMYVPPAEKGSFPNRSIAEKKWHNIWKPFLKRNSVWHTPFQSGRMALQKNNPHIKKLLTIHDLNPLHEGKSIVEQQKSLAHTQKLIDEHDAIVCISEFTKSDVIANCNVGSKPVYVIYNGCNPILMSSAKPSTIVTEKEFFFGLGYVNAKKNYHVLIPLLLTNPEIDLVISGRLDDPDYIVEMKKYAAALGVSDRLHITGPISEAEKAWYLTNSRAFFQPSLAEGFGFPVIEAMSVGKPVFISNRTSLPEIGGSAAFYFPSFEAETIQTVLKNGLNAYDNSNLKELLMAQSKKFDWKNSALKYLQVYSSLLK